MLRNGDTIENPMTKESFTLLRTAEETGGELLRFGVRVGAGGTAVGGVVHVHPVQEERFTIEAGHIDATVDGTREVHGPGAVINVPPGTPHSWKNSSEEELRFVLEFRPAGRWQELFETMFALARDGEVDEKGLGDEYQMALILDAYEDHQWLVGPPIEEQKENAARLAAEARKRGYKAYHPYYPEH